MAVAVLSLAPQQPEQESTQQYNVYRQHRHDVFASWGSWGGVTGVHSGVSRVEEWCRKIAESALPSYGASVLRWIADPGARGLRGLQQLLDRHV